MKKNEIRTNASCNLSVREKKGPDGQSVESRVVGGRAIVFNQPSVLLDEWGDQFREVIAPEAVTQEFLESCDVKMTLFHNREKLLARYMPDREDNTLRLTVTEEGVDFEFEAPHTDYGEQLLEGVRRGDMTGCSFMFVPDFDRSTYSLDQEGVTTITHHRFRWLGEMTVGTDPAYQQTEVHAREVQTYVPEVRAKVKDYLLRARLQKLAREMQ